MRHAAPSGRGGGLLATHLLLPLLPPDENPVPFHVAWHLPSQSWPGLGLSSRLRVCDRGGRRLFPARDIRIRRRQAGWFPLEFEFPDRYPPVGRIAVTCGDPPGKAPPREDLISVGCADEMPAKVSLGEWGRERLMPSDRDGLIPPDAPGPVPGALRELSALFLRVRAEFDREGRGAGQRPVTNRQIAQLAYQSSGRHSIPGRPRSSLTRVPARDSSKLA
jgi:hypothetical protein